MSICFKNQSITKCFGIDLTHSALEISYSKAGIPSAAVLPRLTTRHASDHVLLLTTSFGLMPSACLMVFAVSHTQQCLGTTHVAHNHTEMHSDIHSEVHICSWNHTEQHLFAQIRISPLPFCAPAGEAVPNPAKELARVHHSSGLQKLAVGKGHRGHEVRGSRAGHDRNERLPLHPLRGSASCS